LPRLIRKGERETERQKDKERPDLPSESQSGLIEWRDRETERPRDKERPTCKSLIEWKDTVRKKVRGERAEAYRELDRVSLLS
jgi:hypothetical protein